MNDSALIQSFNHRDHHTYMIYTALKRLMETAKF